MIKLNIILWILLTLVSATLLVSFSKKLGSSIIIGVYASLIVMSQIFATKLVVFGPFIVPGAVIFYAVTYLLTDALNELYGEKEAQNAVYTGLMSSLLLVLGIQLLISWESAPFWDNQEALITILSNTWRVTFASIASYFVSQSLDVWSYNKIRSATGDKKLWLRNNASTMISQSVDTILFIGLAFYGTMPLTALLSMMLGQYIIKLLIALLDTPFLYWLKWLFYKEKK